MIVVLLLGATLGYIVVRAHDQRDAVAAIQGAGGSVIYDWQWQDGNYDLGASLVCRVG